MSQSFDILQSKMLSKASPSLIKLKEVKNGRARILSIFDGRTLFDLNLSIPIGMVGLIDFGAWLSDTQ